MEGIKSEQSLTYKNKSERINKNQFLISRAEDYKNPDMFDLEPSYLKTLDYNKKNFTPHQYYRKISELARRLGLAFSKKNPDSAYQKSETGVKIFKEIVSDDVSEIILTFYEDDSSQPFNIEVEPDFQDLDFSDIRENAVEIIERRGKNLQRRTERPIFENGVLPTDDNSRVREIILKRKDGTEVVVVSKRISLTKVRREPFEEFEILQKVQEEGLLGPKPIAIIEACGNRYILMEKVDGILLKKITLETLQKYLGQEDVQVHMDKIRAKVDELKQQYAKSNVVREDWNAKDLIVSYDTKIQEWIVIPVDFEKTKLRE